MPFVDTCMAGAQVSRCQQAQKNRSKGGGASLSRVPPQEAHLHMLAEAQCLDHPDQCPVSQQRRVSHEHVTQ